MSFVLTPSRLEEIALVKVVAALWNHGDIRSLISNFDFSLTGEKCNENWQKIENKVIEKIPQLQTPKLMQEKVLCFITLTGLQILRWIQCHFANDYFGKILPNEFYWTSQGTIDRKKTAEVLIKDESIDLTTCFILACAYCLEDNIVELWNKMPPNDKKSFQKNKLKISFLDDLLVRLWIYDIKGEMSKMRKMMKRKYHLQCSPYRYAFQCAANYGNKVATEHFFQKLTSREKEKSLVDVAKYVACNRVDSYSCSIPKKDFSDVLCFLLLQMDETERAVIFENCTFEVLKCLLDWPWQIFFTETANPLMNSLTIPDFYHLLTKIIYRTVYCYKELDYQNIFKEFWQRSLDENKRFVIENDDKHYEVLSHLFQVKDADNIKLVFQEASPAEKIKFATSLYGPLIFQELNKKDEYGLMKLFAVECLSSDREIAKFRRTYIDFLSIFYSRVDLKKNKVQWRKGFKLLDKYDSEYKKRKRAKANESKLAKRLKTK